MPKAKKKASDLTDKALFRRLFPKDARKLLKDMVLELDREKAAKRKPRKP